MKKSILMLATLDAWLSEKRQVLSENEKEMFEQVLTECHKDANDILKLEALIANGRSLNNQINDLNQQGRENDSELTAFISKFEPKTEPIEAE